MRKSLRDSPARLSFSFPLLFWRLDLLWCQPGPWSPSDIASLFCWGFFCLYVLHRRFPWPLMPMLHFLGYICLSPSSNCIRLTTSHSLLSLPCYTFPFSPVNTQKHNLTNTPQKPPHYIPLRLYKPYFHSNKYARMGAAHCVMNVMEVWEWKILPAGIFLVQPFYSTYYLFCPSFFTFIIISIIPHYTIIREKMTSKCCSTTIT